MENLGQAQRYGQDWASVYDDWFPFDEQGEAAVAKLADLAGTGRVLELAIGSGRLALPLASRGLHVEGVDASEAMIELLRAKPGGAAIPVTVGNLRDVPVAGNFELIFIAFNTIFGLLTQDEQVTCVRNAAAHLTDTGCFVAECFVPDRRRLADSQQVRLTLVADDETRFHLLQHDAVRQQIHGQTVRITRDGQTTLFPTHIRYIWPSELDLMAQLAGLRLRNRWGGWACEPFTDDSNKHVSVYERA